MSQEFPVTQISPTRVIKLVVISICNGIGIPLIALLSTIHHLERQGWNIQIVYTLVVEKDAEANDISRNVLLRHGYPQPIEILPLLENLVDWVNQFLHARSVLPITGTHVCVLSGTPCKSISYGCQANKTRQQFGLHAGPSNLWFLAHAAIKAICSWYPPFSALL